MFLGGFASLWVGCSANPATTGVGAAAPPVSVSVPSEGASAAATPEPAKARTAIELFPVARIYSLIDATTTTDGGVELRMGIAPGGGAASSFRYVPLVDGVPDFAEATDDIDFRDTTGVGVCDVYGGRPHLILHGISGFRSGPSEYYQVLDDDNGWRGSTSSLGAGPGFSNGVMAWSGDRLLEWRSESLMSMGESPPDAQLPLMSVLRGKDQHAPSLSKSLEKRLTEEGFTTQTLTALKTGEVLAVGLRERAGGIGTVLWTTDLESPAYFVQSPDEPIDASELRILGGDSLASIRLLAGSSVMKLEGTAWVVESTVPENGLPDVWFGSTGLAASGDKEFARMGKGEPWLPITVGDPKAQHSYVVDKQGTIWATEDDQLLSSKKPASTRDLDEQAIVEIRKASILHGGSDDATGEPPNAYGEHHCRMHYVLLDKSPIASAPKDFPKVRAALKGHTELAAAKFIVSHELGWQLFGASIKEEATATKLAKLSKSPFSSVICAEPVPVSELKIDLATGALAP